MGNRTFRFVAVLFALALAAPLAAQTADPAANTALREQVERRFDVLPLHDGIALRPKSLETSVRSIELADGTIALDGRPATGAELRERLGRDADLVLRLSYLDAAAQRALFGPPEPSPRVAPAPSPEPAPEPSPEMSPGEIREHAREAAREALGHRRERTGNARVRIGGSITIGPDETVTNDVVCVGGSADVQGRVTGDVVVIGGSTTLGPSADVSGDVVVIGGTLHRDRDAHVGGQVSEVSIGALNVDGWRRVPFGALAWPSMWHGVALASTLMRFVVLCLLACIVVLFGHRHVELVGARAAAEPVKAGLIGLFAELLFFPLLVVCAIVLVVTIIGIPLLLLIPFALLAAAIVALVGFTSVAWRIGRVVSERLGWAAPSPYAVAVVGVAAVVAPVLLARVLGLAGSMLFPITAALLALGLLFEYLVWTVGIGAIALVRFARPGTVLPAPAAPAAPTPASA